MTWARTTYRWLIWLFVLGVGVQFLFAGLGVLGGESIDPHKGLGSLLQLISVLLMIVAAVAKLDRPVLFMTIGLAVLTILQSVWAIEDLSPMWLRSFHVLGAFGIVGLSQQLAMRAGPPLGRRSESNSQP